MQPANYIKPVRTTLRYVVAFHKGNHELADLYMIVDTDTLKYVEFGGVAFSCHLQSSAILMCRELNGLKEY